jgi:DNA (cytosine-5)-methyltransferase 1
VSDVANEIEVDNFACAGGASDGIEEATGRPIAHAINHNPKALAVHMANHPLTTHHCENIRNLNPLSRQLDPHLPVGLGWFSPDCTYHSKARGGKPFRDANRARRVRGLAGSVHWWMRTRRPRVVMLENVEEFAHWGPLLEDGKPDPRRRGKSFQRWHRIIENMGYRVDMRELVACDYGVPTSRKRLFVIARCDGEEIVFPEMTHGPGLRPYASAADCIDWSLPCPSIFSRPRELAEATKRRIARGVMRYCVNTPEPFIVGIDNKSNGARDVWAGDEPLRTITTENRFALVTPFMASMRGTEPSHIDRSARAIDEPLRTVSAGGTHHMLVTPFIVNTRNGEREGQAPRVRDIREPYPTITAQGSQGAVAMAFLARHYGGHENDGSSLWRPMHTITTKDHHSLVMAFLLKYYGTDQDPQLRAPLHTITTKDRFGLVMVRGEPHRIVDIGMRMLTPRELARATSFRDDYILNPEYQGKPLSKADQVWMIGNAVPPKLAQALVASNYTPRQKLRRAA